MDAWPLVSVVRASLDELPALVRDLRAPLVVQGITLASSRAFESRGFGSWPQALASKLKQLDGPVEYSLVPEQRFYDPGKPLAKLKAVDAPTRRGSSLYRNMSAAALFSRLRNASAARAWEEQMHVEGDRCAAAEWWSYLATNATNTVALVRQLSQLDQIAAASQPSGSRADSSSTGSQSATVWVGGEGLSSPCRHEASVSFFAQLHGQTHFWLADPQAAALLQPFSGLHPRFGLVQRTPEELVRLGAPLQWLSQARLKPGELLLLPPYHFRALRVASSLAISANVRVSNEALEAVQGLLERGGGHFGLSRGPTGLLTLEGPFEDERVRIALLESLSQRLVLGSLMNRRTGLSTIDSARRWVQKAMRPRWAAVQARYPKQAAKFERLCDPLFFEARDLSWKSALGERQATVSRGIDSAALMLRALTVGAAELELANLIEKIALDVLNETKAVCSFLLGCFRGGSADVGNDGEPTEEARQRFESKYKENY